VAKAPLTVRAGGEHCDAVMGGDLPAGLALERLKTTLEAALRVAQELATDELAGRLLSTFHAMPAEDREVIVGVFEREVQRRLLSRGTEAPVGQSTRANPNARLYIRAHESGFDRRTLERDEMMVANIRAMRVAAIVRNVPEIHATWRDAMRGAMDQVDDATRAIVEDLVHEVVSFIAEARAVEAGADVPPVATSSATKDGRRS